MRQLTAFVDKELKEGVRTGKMTVLLVLFVLFGVMNPAIAKLTPWLMEMMAGDLAETGLVITAAEVNALTSWGQFYKNIPIALIIFLMMFSGILTGEYQRGTLITMVTKGMKRWKIIAAKAFLMMVLWTGGYWLCYGITYGYNAYFWDNGIVPRLFFSAVCFYFLGIWLISLLLLMSTVFTSNSSAVVAAGGVFLGLYLLGLLPAAGKYLPVRLLSVSGLLTGAETPMQFVYAIAAAVFLTVFNMAIAVVCFNKNPLCQ